MTIIQDIKETAAGRDLSVKWYRSQITALGGNKLTGKMLINSSDNSIGKSAERDALNKEGLPRYGKMNLFAYAPETAKKLPYYDMFPLIIPIERAKGGILGINFHYLPIPLRVQLLKLLTETFGDETGTRMTNLTWRQLSGYRKVLPIVRHYKYKNIRSKFLQVSLEDMIIAILLPVQRFYKGPLDNKTSVEPRKVYMDTRSKI